MAISCRNNVDELVLALAFAHNAMQSELCSDGYHRDLTQNTTSPILNEGGISVTTVTVSAPAATNLATTVVLTNQLLGVLNQHMFDDQAHLIKDLVNQPNQDGYTQVTASLDADGGLSESITLLNALKILFNSHLTQGATSFASGFGALAHSTLTNTGATSVTGDIGLYPGTSITGFPPGTFTGTEHLTDGAAASGQAAALTAYTTGQALPAGTAISSITNGTTLTPGTYTASSSLNLTGGTVTLSGNGTFVFQIGSTLVTASATQVVLANGAQAANVSWLVGSSATLGTGTSIVGNIFAEDSITDNGGSTVNGRLVALTAAITLNDTTLVVPAVQGTAGQVHPNNDTANNVSTANATNLATAETLANAMQTAVNNHMASVGSNNCMRINVRSS